MDGINTVTIVEYSPVAAGLAELRQKYEGVVYDCTSPTGMRDAKEARAELRARRLKLEEIRKEIKAPALARAKAIDTEAKAILERIEALEEPIAQQIEAEAMREKEAARKREEAEAARVKAINDQINGFRTSASRLAGSTPAAIEAAIGALRDTSTASGFDEFATEAEAERVAAINALSVMLDGARARESERQRVELERAELERLRRENAEAERARREAEDKAAASERARLDAVAASERAEREREFAANAGASPSQADAGVDAAIKFSGALIAPRAETGVLSPYGILLEAMHKLRALAIPGSEEHQIIETALRDAGIN